MKNIKLEYKISLIEVIGILLIAGFQIATTLAGVFGIILLIVKFAKWISS